MGRFPSLPPNDHFITDIRNKSELRFFQLPRKCDLSFAFRWVKYKHDVHSANSLPLLSVGVILLPQQLRDLCCGGLTTLLVVFAEGVELFCGLGGNAFALQVFIEDLYSSLNRQSRDDCFRAACPKVR